MAEKPRVIDIVNRTVKELWGWKPSGRVIPPEQQCEMIKAELAYSFRSGGMKATSIEVRLHRSGSGALVIECIVDGVVQICAYDRITPPGFDMQGGNDGEL